MSNPFKYLICKPKGKGTVGWLRARKEDTIKITFRDIGCGSVDRTGFVSTAMNIGFQKSREFHYELNDNYSRNDPLICSFNGYRVLFGPRTSNCITANHRCRAVFSHSNTAIVGSNPTRGMNVRVRLFYVYISLCVGSDLATACPLSKESYQLCVD
jgi:hypothetical protein